MALYKSKFAKFGFYVEGERKQFLGGRYTTTDKKEMEVLDKLPDVQKVDEKAEGSTSSKSKSTTGKVTTKKTSAK